MQNFKYSVLVIRFHSDAWSTGHESWAITERMRLQMQASKMTFLKKINGVTMFDKIRTLQFDNF